MRGQRHNGEGNICTLPVRQAIAVLVCVALAAACAADDEHRNPCSTCSQSVPISWSQFLVTTDHAKLYLLARGDRRDASIVLWLHGGPGAAERPLFRLYNGALEQQFVVAYWDQRGAGYSFDPKADPSRLTIAQHLRDLDLVVTYLLKRLNQSKLIVVGHSWGSALGLLYAREHPEKVAAFVGVAQFVSGMDTQRAQYQFITAEARKRNDRSALDTIARICKPPFDAHEVLIVQGLVDRFGGYFYQRPSILWATVRAVVRGYVTPWAIPRFIEANNVSLAAMHDQLLALDLRRAVTSVGVPVTLMLGRYDHQLDARLAAGYFDRLSAPEKRLILFDRSAHNIPFEQPELFNKTLVRVLAPQPRSAATRGN